MSDVEQALAVYLPVDRHRALATKTPLPEQAQGAVLFADVSGFTPLMEALTRELGPRRGVEELPQQLNLVYDALIQEVDRYGGSVIGFAGDAITCWFDQDSGLRATACGLAMQAAIRTFATIQLPSGSTVSLAVKISVASGTVLRFLVGDPDVQLIDTLAGAPLLRMAAAEHVAAKGEVILDEATANALGEALMIQAWRSDEHGARFAIVARLRARVEPRPWAALPPGSLTVEQFRPWLLPTVYERLQAGQGEFLTELRPVVALFLRFEGIDYDSNPESRQQLDTFVRWVQSLLVQYEGTLLSVTIGDKGSYLYLGFGVPVAHENDSRRAALAALALRTPPSSLSFITKIHIGLSRGTMRTGAYGGTTRRTYGALGDEVNVAARLMEVARQGEIIVSGRVHQAVARLFRWQPLPEIHVKGKHDSIPIFALLGEMQARPLSLAESTYSLPIVGRQAEQGLILDRLALARQGQGQVVGITAEAGMGKSRLVAEAIRLAQGQGFTTYGGECHSHGTNTPYLVWQPIWRAFFGLEAPGAPERQAEQVARAVRELSPALLPRLPLLAPLLGLRLENNELTGTFSPELRKASREALVVDLLRVHARVVGPVLLVLEDCHWLDTASHDLLIAIGHAIWDQPVLILLAYRPPELERLVAPRVSTLPYFTLLPLAELDETEMAHLIANRLTDLYPHETQPPPAPLVRQLAARAQGNPFYLEELLNFLHDQALDPYQAGGVAALELPSSLHSLILSRIDRLTEPQKVTLKVASIIGRLFRLSWLVGYYPTLGEPALVQANLDLLARLDLTPLERGEPEQIYLFKHILTREVAYESLPYATRARLHEQLAAFLEQRGATEVEGYLDLLAYHYALSENRSKAREYLRRAGEAAQATYANGAAQAYYEHLLPLLEEPGERMDLHLRLGAVLEVVGAWEKAQAHYQSAFDLASTAGYNSARARSMFALGTLHRLRGQYEEAQRWLHQALAEWEGLGEAGGIGQTLTELGVVGRRQGAYERAVGYLEQSRALCQGRGDRAGLADTLNNLGIVAANQGDYAGAQSLHAESLALRRELGDKRTIATSLGNLGLAALFQENYVIAQTLFEESLALCREMGDKRGMVNALGNLGLVALTQRRFAHAQTLLEACLALCREMGHKQGQGLALINLGHVACCKVNVAAAHGHYQGALRLAHDIGEKWMVTMALLGLGVVAARQQGTPSLHQAARLLGATEALRTALNIQLEPLEQGLYAEALATVRAALSEADFAAAWAEGQAMTLGQAVALALVERGVSE